MFVAALFTIVKLWKQPRCPLLMNGSRKCDTCTQWKKNEILSFEGKWMKLEKIILSEVSQAQKTKISMFSLICGL
jgi:hypothetical protein